MKAVIDTNGLLRSVPRDGSYRWLYDAFAAGQFTWVVSNEIMLEYAEMTAFYFSPTAAELVTSLLLASPHHLRQEAYFRFGLIIDDPEDRNAGPQQIRRLRHCLRCRLAGIRRPTYIKPAPG